MILGMNHPISSKLRTSLLALAGVLLLGAASAQAQTYLIDFGDPSDTTASPDVNGNYWTNISGFNQANLIPSTSLITTTGNTTTGVSINSGTTTWGFNIGGTGYTGTAITGPLGVSTAYNDIMFIGTSGTASTGQLILTGLNTSASYTFTFISARSATGAARNIDLNFVGSNSVDSGVINAITPDGLGNGTLNVVSGVHPDLTGTITINASFTGSTAGYLDALEIQTVIAPEPSTVALSIIGGLGLFFVVLRRRRSAQIL